METKLITASSLEEVFEAMNTPTDTQLKQALAKMLPDKVRATPSGLYLWWNPNEPECGSNTSRVVLPTELLHLCWMVEETLNPSADKEMECNTPNVWRDYVTRLDADCYKNGGHSCVHATWQQRVLALSNVLGVEI